MSTTLEVVQRGTSLVDLPPELLTVICLLVACPTVVWCRLVAYLLSFRFRWVDSRERCP